MRVGDFNRLISGIQRGGSRSDPEAKRMGYNGDTDDAADIYGPTVAFCDSSATGLRNDPVAGGNVDNEITKTP